MIDFIEKENDRGFRIFFNLISIILYACGAELRYFFIYISVAWIGIVLKYFSFCCMVIKNRLGGRKWWATIRGMKYGGVLYRGR